MTEGMEIVDTVEDMVVDMVEVEEDMVEVEEEEDMAVDTKEEEEIAMVVGEEGVADFMVEVNAPPETIPDIMEAGQEKMN